jgi:hypothetical protein
MPTALETYVGTELNRRPAYLTVAICSYDGDPNEVAAPAIIDNAPAGTFYGQETPDQVWQKNPAGTWTVVSGIDLSAVGEDILPSADNVSDLGSALKRWAEVRAVAGVFTSVSASSLSTSAEVRAVAGVFTSVSASSLSTSTVSASGEIEFVIAARTVNPEVRHSVVTDASASRTLTNADWGRTIEMSHATPTVVCPISLMVGFWCKVRGSTAALTIDDDGTSTIVASATVATPYTTTGQWADAVIECRASNIFKVTGELTAA